MIFWDFSIFIPNRIPNIAWAYWERYRTYLFSSTRSKARSASYPYQYPRDLIACSLAYRRGSANCSNDGIWIDGLIGLHGYCYVHKFHYIIWAQWIESRHKQEHRRCVSFLSCIQYLQEENWFYILLQVFIIQYPFFHKLQSYFLIYIQLASGSPLYCIDACIGDYWLSGTM